MPKLLSRSVKSILKAEQNSRCTWKSPARMSFLFRLSKNIGQGSIRSIACLALPSSERYGLHKYKTFKFCIVDNKNACSRIRNKKQYLLYCFMVCFFRSGFFFTNQFYALSCDNATPSIYWIFYSSPRYYFSKHLILTKGLVSFQNAIAIEIAPRGLLQAILKRSIGPDNITVSLTSNTVSSNVVSVLGSLGQ